MIGPELPPGFRPAGAAAAPEESEPPPAFIGPPLPPPRKVYGPSIDPPCTTAAVASSESSSSSSSDDDSDDEAGEYGPLPAGAEGAAGERAAAAFEEACAQAEKDQWAALRGHGGAAAEDSGCKRGHEEWMTALPEERRGFGLLFRVVVIAL